MISSRTLYLYSFFCLFLFVGTVTAQTSVTTQASATFINLPIKVKGITCSKDVATISDNVKKMKGVSSCKLVKKGATSSFDVSFDSSLVSQEDIIKIIEDTPGCKNPKDRPYKVKI